MGVLIEPVSWDLLEMKMRLRGTPLDGVPAQSRIEILSLPNDVEQVRTLEQLGIREAEYATVRSTAPMGGPILLEIGGSSVAIARGLARKIRVQLL